VVWAVAKGSLLNKAILVPAALAISAFAPWAVVPLLMVGGAFLCFEGFEKLAHKFLHSAAEGRGHQAELTQALADPQVDLVALEKDKIKGAVRTDFILSAEIIAITLGTVATRPSAPRCRGARHRAGDDDRRLRLRGRHRQARRPGPVAEPPRPAPARRRWAAAS
jgi:predicted DNA repair protein MutK